MLKKYPVTEEVDYRKRFYTPVIEHLKAAKAIKGVKDLEKEKEGKEGGKDRL